MSATRREKLAFSRRAAPRRVAADGLKKGRFFGKMCKKPIGYIARAMRY